MAVIYGNKPGHGKTAPFVTRPLPQAVTRGNIMAKALTVKAIENLKPSAERREISDGEVGGLYLQIFPSGGRSWAFRYRFARRSRKLTLGSELTLRQARDLAREAHGVLARGQDPAEQKKEARIAARPAIDRIEDIVEQFLARHVSTLGTTTQHEVSRLLRKEVAAPWRGRRLSEISRADIHNLLDKIVDRPAPIQANRVLAWLRAMSNWAIGRGLIEVSPCLGIKAPAPAKSRDRVLSDDDLAAVWRASEVLSAPYGEFLRLLVLLGQRRTEVAAMTWDELDLEKKLWTLPGTRAKNKQTHQVPLCDSAVEILRSVPRIDGCPYVFTVSGRRPLNAFFEMKRQIDARAPGLTPWVLHDLRRTCASGLARLRVAPHVIEAALNHRSGVVSGLAAVYNKHDYGDERRAALEAWARHVAAIAGGESANVIPMTTLAGRGQ
jgi:integrase